MTSARFVSLLFSSYLFIAQAYANEIVVPVDHYPPWKFTTTTESISGIDIQLANLLLEKANLKAEYQAYPWKRCLLMMRNGEADLISGVTRRAERETYMHFIEPPYKTTSTKAFYVLRGEEDKIQSYEDLQNKRIGVVRGVKLFERFDKDNNLDKTEVAMDDQNLEMLLANRIDTFVATESTADFYIAQKGYENLISKAVYSYDKPVNVYFAISKKSRLANRLEELSNIVKDMVNSGEVDAIIKQYSKADDS